MKLSKNNKKGFFLGFLASLIILLTLQVLTNVIVDPYGIFNIVSINNFNLEKPGIEKKIRFYKSLTTCANQPEAIILGSSRVEMGIDPNHPSIHTPNFQAYNFGLYSANLEEIFHALKHAYYASNANLKLAIIGLDHFMFHSIDEAPETTASNRELMTNYVSSNLISKNHYCERFLLKNMDHVFFNHALVSSFLTLNHQSIDNAYIKNGARDPRKNKYVKRTKSLGPYWVFSAYEQHTIKTILSTWKDKDYNDLYSDGSSTFDILRKIIKFSRDNSIELKLYLSPAHVRLLHVLKELNFWESIADFKRGIVEVVNEDALSNPGNPIPVWDFLTYNSLSTEILPEAKEKGKEMQWFWDDAHYKTAVGDLILDILMGTKVNTSDLPANFGILLTQENIATMLSKLHTHSIEYENSHPDEILKIRAQARTLSKNF